MTIVIQPQNLVGKYNVQFHFDDFSTADAPAMVTAQINDKTGIIEGYDLYMYYRIIKNLYYASALKDQGLYEQYCAGLLIHEIMHILNNSFKFLMPYAKNDPISQYIWNIIIDSHDEYKASYWYPVYAPYVQLALSILKWHTPTQAPDNELTKDLHTWFHLVRFGVVPDYADPEFSQFASLVALTGVRGSSQDALDAAIAIYEYLRIKYQKSKSKNKQQQWKDAQDSTGLIQRELMNQSDMDAVATMTRQLGTSQGGQPLAPTNGGNDPTPQSGAGLEKIVIDMEGDDSFYASTTTAFSEEITEIEQRFQRMLNTAIETFAYDGDMGMGISEMMGLFEASFTGEDFEGYLQSEYLALNTKIAVSTDISYSTDDFKVAYAQATVMFLAAFERINGIKTALIQFNGMANEIYGFDSDVRKSAIRPRAGGGTELSPVLDIVDTYTWDGADNIHLIITDGDIYDWYDCESRIEDMRAKGIYTFVIELVETYSATVYLTGRYPYAFKSTLKDLPDRMMNVLIASIIKHRGVVLS